MTGSYGSGKYTLASNLKKYGSDNSKYDIFRVSSDNLLEKIPTDSYI